jgi:hypothetical protein
MLQVPNYNPPIFFTSSTVISKSLAISSAEMPFASMFLTALAS